MKTFDDKNMICRRIADFNIAQISLLKIVK